MKYIEKEHTAEVKLIVPEEFWKEFIQTRFRTIFIISDIDGTLNEKSLILCKFLEKLSELGYPVYFMIATGKSIYERQFSTKIKSDCAANHASIIIGQGGSVVRFKNGSVIKDYIFPLKNALATIKNIAKATGRTMEEMFRGEHLCIHFYDVEKCKEVIGIPIALADEEEIKSILSRFNGDIVEAYLQGALNNKYSLAIAEYLERGMPREEIGVLYESELPEKATTITELTIVMGELKKYEENLRKYGIKCRIQQEIADRYVGTRGAAEGIHPDIADIVSFGKKEHIDAIIAAMMGNGITIGLGDQGNDDFLYSTNYSFVANAARMSNMNAGWDFAISMAEMAEKNPEMNVIHARHSMDGNIINWAVELIASCGTYEEVLETLDFLTNSKLNMRIREFLLNMRKES